MSEDYQAPSGAGLSPAAQAVLDAVEDHGKFHYGSLAAAALRAAADLERQSPWYKRTGRFVNCSPAPAGAPGREGCGARWMRDQILAIADELENH